jgi:anti-sigma regulatory factor (Ser/Thr protein kinase)
VNPSDHALPHDRSAPRLARSLVHEVFAPVLAKRQREDMAILVSEVVANAIRHAPPRPDGTIGLRLGHENGVARVVVQDGGDQPLSSRPDTAAGSSDEHLGFRLLDRLATRWGAGTERRNAVWFELDMRPGARDA